MESFFWFCLGSKLLDWSIYIFLIIVFHFHVIQIFPFFILGGDDFFWTLWSPLWLELFLMFLLEIIIMAVTIFIFVMLADILILTNTCIIIAVSYHYHCDDHDWCYNECHYCIILYLIIPWSIYFTTSNYILLYLFYYL